MFSDCLLRLALVATLVFAQAVSAGHDGVHGKNRLADCQICLHASAAGTALPSLETAPFLPPSAAVPQWHCAVSAPCRPFPRSHRARAPPVFPA